MRKLALLGLVVVLTTGCGRGWLPLFRGARCGSGCGLAAPAQPASHENDCVGCGTSTGYGSYDGEVVGGDSYLGGDVVGDSGYYNSPIVDGGIVNGGIVNGGYIGQGTTIPSPSMTPLPAN